MKVYNNIDKDKEYLHQTMRNKFQIKSNLMEGNMVAAEGNSLLGFYQGLCTQFPDITFRLTDMSKWKEGDIDRGYQGKSHQQGERFSMPGQCSIEIDVSVIEKMQKDERYVHDVRQ